MPMSPTSLSMASSTRAVAAHYGLLDERSAARRRLRRSLRRVKGANTSRANTSRTKHGTGRSLRRRRLGGGGDDSSKWAAVTVRLDPQSGWMTFA